MNRAITCGCLAVLCAACSPITNHQVEKLLESPWGADTNRQAKISQQIRDNPRIKSRLMELVAAYLDHPSDSASSRMAKDRSRRALRVLADARVPEAAYWLLYAGDGIDPTPSGEESNISVYHSKVLIEIGEPTVSAILADPRLKSESFDTARIHTFTPIILCIKGEADTRQLLGAAIAQEANRTRRENLVSMSNVIDHWAYILKQDHQI